MSRVTSRHVTMETSAVTTCSVDTGPILPSSYGFYNHGTSLIKILSLLLYCNGKLVFQTLLGKGKNIAMLISISRPSLLLQRTEGRTVSPVLLQMRGSQPGPGPHLGVASSSIRDLFCTNCFTLHLSTGRQHRQTHAPAATLGETKSGPSYTFFCDDDFSSEYQEKKWRHLSCPWPIRCVYK